MANDLQKELEALREAIERIVPYVQATLGVPGLSNGVDTGDPDWIAVHKGRAYSSYHQLNSLLKRARGAE